MGSFFGNFQNPIRRDGQISNIDSDAHDLHLGGKNVKKIGSSKIPTSNELDKLFAGAISTCDRADNSNAVHVIPNDTVTTVPDGGPRQSLIITSTYEDLPVNSLRSTTGNTRNTCLMYFKSCIDTSASK